MTGAGRPYDVDWSARAKRAMQRLPEGVAAAAVELVYGALAEAPRRLGKPLQFDFEGLLSARRGDYRVIYQVDDERRLITVVEVAHRRDAYRRG